MTGAALALAAMLMSSFVNFGRARGDSAWNAMIFGGAWTAGGAAIGYGLEQLIRWAL